MTDCMPDAEREAMEWLDTYIKMNLGSVTERARTLKRMLANRLPARLYEEDAVAIAEKLTDAGWYSATRQSVQAYWMTSRAHLADPPPKPPTPKTKTAFRVSVCDDRVPRISVSTYHSRAAACERIAQEIGPGITVNLTTEEVPA